MKVHEGEDARNGGVVFCEWSTECGRVSFRVCRGGVGGEDYEAR